MDGARTVSAHLGKLSILLVSLALAACGGSSELLASNDYGSAANSAALGTLGFREAAAAGYIAPACGTQPASGHARCIAWFLTPSGASALNFPGHSTASNMRSTLSSCLGSCTPFGSSAMTPQQLQAAYGLTAAATADGAGRTVAVVEAYGSTSLESDLGVFRSEYGLPSCTTANGCFRKVAQNGGTSYPANSLAWAWESDLDTQVVSSICPKCNILVVEANSEALSDLAASVNEAVALGAFAVSNSYSAAENSSLLQYASAYSHPGVTITAASGDALLAPSMPADFSTVISVGGTQLSAASNSRGYTEAVWSGVGGVGCSAIVAKPAWQTDTGCSMRTVADVSFEIDGGTMTTQLSLPIYDSQDVWCECGPNGTTPPIGWSGANGTSFGSPAIAAMYALAGVAAANASGFYKGGAGNAGLIDITSGSTENLDSNGLCTVPAALTSTLIDDVSRRASASTSDLPAYFCNAEVGYDAPSGNGSPYGLSAFVTVGTTPAPTATPTAAPTAAPTSGGWGGGRSTPTPAATAACPTVTIGATPTPRPTLNAGGPGSGCSS